MKESINLEILVNLAVTFEKKVDYLMSFLDRDSELVGLLDISKFGSKHERTRDALQEIARRFNDKKIILMVTAADKLLQEMKKILHPLENNFSKLADEVAAQFVFLGVSGRSKEQKKISNVFNLVLTAAQGSALNYRILCHPGFLKIAYN